MTPLKAARRLGVAFALGGAIGSTTVGAASGAEAEYAVKADFLYKFGPFVEWPKEVLASGSFTVCVFGDDPFGQVLDNAVSNQSIDGRPIGVRRLQTTSGLADCQVLYVGHAPGHVSADALRAVDEMPVLTVTDEQQEVTGGIVHFIVKDGRVRFSVDSEKAQASGLTISSKLLGLSAPQQKAGE